MKNIISILILLSFCFKANSQQKPVINKEKIVNEIKNMEADFQKDLKTHGVEYAFYTYAAANAVIKRGNDSLIFGKEAIRKFYSAPVYKRSTVEWAPDYIDISDDGSMAYTYGKYHWHITDESGKTTNYEGVFHTVWKRMADGSWKYVWD